jgi:DNA-3-methyladenine glycosylase II
MLTQHIIKEVIIITIYSISSDSPEIKYLCNSDPQFSKLISVIGNLEVFGEKNFYTALINSIIGQQLSVKAASTIIGGLKEIINKDLNPSQIDLKEDEELRNVGVSMRKISFIKDLNRYLREGHLNLDRLDCLSDDEVIKELTKVKDIGQWTAQMFLIFSLGRRNVLAIDDVGLQRSNKWLMCKNDDQDGKILLSRKETLWAPYCTYASLYLWEAVNRGYVDSYMDINEMLSYSSEI